MSRIARLALVPALVLASAAQAQSTSFQDASYVQPVQGGMMQGNTNYDTARIVSVVPVSGGYASAPQQRCYTRDGYASGSNGYYGNDGSYGNNGYAGNGYGNDPYRRDGYYGRNDGYYSGNDGYGAPRQNNGTGRMMAGVVGSVVGAVIGSQMGNGAGRYIGTAIGSAVGGVAGQGVYDSSQRQRQRPASVTVCDPEPAGGYANGNAQWYDVTYAYGGRTYTSRMPYRPAGDTLRVRVDVQPQQ